LGLVYQRLTPDTDEIVKTKYQIERIAKMKISIETLKTLIMYHISEDNKLEKMVHLIAISDYISKRVYHSLEVLKLNDLLTKLNEVHGYDK